MPRSVPVPEWARSLDRIELAVFVSGVASMGLELLAGRIVAPEFGSSIYTWGSIIGVFLVALSLGYHVGGTRARDRASADRLTHLLIIAALYVGVIAFAADAFLAVGNAAPVGTRFAALIPIALLFGPPTYLLGFVSPYAAELSRRDGVGETAGRVYTLGTVGSIVGTFLTTFVLIPSLDVATIELAFGLLLAGTGIVVSRGYAAANAGRVAAVVILLVAAVAANMAGAGLSPATLGGAQVYETNTPYHHLEVRDGDGVRTLYLDDQPQSAMYLDGSGRHAFEYTRYFHLPYLFADDPAEIDRVLFVGGGGFTGPKRFVDEYDATVDVVELDPAVVDVAKRYFGVEESDRLRIHVGDGRRFLEESDTEYDLIVLDAYRKDKVPFHLTTREFFELASDRLSDDGMVVANLISAPAGPSSEFLRAEYRTLEAVFPQVYAFPTTSSETAVQNVELIATKNATKVTPATLRARNDRRAVGVDLSTEIGRYRASVPTDDVPTLTDDRAPVDRLLDPLLGQKYVVERTRDDNGSPRVAGGADRPAALAADVARDTPTASAGPHVLRPVASPGGAPSERRHSRESSTSRSSAS